MMDYEKILGHVDHTLLKQASTWEEITQLCDDAIKYQTASVCIPPSFVERVKARYKNQLKICTVIGFPNGYNTTQSKVFETQNALKNGADEIDVVINIGDLKDKQYDKILNELKQVKAECGDKVLKVIIETCLLTEEEKIKMCELVTLAKADYIKTSTGFSTAGATLDDIALFKKHIGEGVKMKAAGGIKNFEDAEAYLNLGCDRLGTSALVKAVKP